jgi:hypothetical protein
MAQFSVKIIRLNGAVLDENQQAMEKLRWSPTTRAMLINDIERTKRTFSSGCALPHYLNQVPAVSLSMK